MKHVGTLLAIVILALSIVSPSVAQNSYLEIATQATGATPSPAPNRDQPIPLGGGLVLLYYYFVQVGDDVNAYGELLNTDAVAHRAPAVNFTFLDENGNEYLTGSASPTSRWIGAGQALGFQGFVIQKTLRLGDWAAVSVARGWMPPEAVDYYDTSGVVISGASPEGAVVDGAIIDGKLENPSSVAIAVDVLNIEYRDASGRFVGSCGDYLDASIPPGKFVRFSVALSDSGLCGYQSPAIQAGAEFPLQYRLIPARV